ncbi:MAG: indolepyruvate oxidoreductase subunit beta [Thermoplasmataceae archaeon]
MKTNLIIGGIGGQGVVTCGTLISKAAIHSGINVIMSEIHGLAQRGGSVSVEVRMGEVHGPIIPDGQGDLLIGLEYMEGIRNLWRLRKGATAILSPEKMTPVSLSMNRKEYPDFEELLSKEAKKLLIYEINAPSLAIESGDRRTSNSVILGFISALKILPLTNADFIDAISSTFPEKVMSTNLRAFELGSKEVTRAKLRGYKQEIIE